jgi:hypothetical protein
MCKRKVRTAIPPMRPPVIRRPTNALCILHGRVTITRPEVFYCVMRENAVRGRPTKCRLQTRGAAMLECECGVSKEGAETVSRAGDFVECDVSCLGGGIMIKEDDDAGEDVEVETDRYTGHDKYM